VNKERARRRAEREREAAIRSAARAAQAERRERRRSRRRRLHAATAGRVRPLTSSGRQAGILARRSRRQTTGLVAVLVLLNLVVWVLHGDWPAVLGALVVSLLVYPVLKLLLFARH
jgi:Flp pilus assembly protein TadB